MHTQNNERVMLFKNKVNYGVYQDNTILIQTQKMLKRTPILMGQHKSCCFQSLGANAFFKLSNNLNNVR